MNYYVKDLAAICDRTPQTIRNTLKTGEFKEQVINTPNGFAVNEETAKKLLAHFGVDESALIQTATKPTNEEQEQTVLQSAQSDFLHSELEALKNQLAEKDKQINSLLEQVSQSQELLTKAQESITTLTEANKELSTANQSLIETNKVLSATNAIKEAAEKKEILLAQPQETETEKEPVSEKIPWWKKIFG